MNAPSKPALHPKDTPATPGSSPPQAAAAAELSCATVAATVPDAVLPAPDAELPAPEGKGVSTPSPAGLHKAIVTAPKGITKNEQAQQSSSERKLTKSVGKAASVRARAKRCAREASANEEAPLCT
jgi:hypothetical protein